MQILPIIQSIKKIQIKKCLLIDSILICLLGYLFIGLLPSPATAEGAGLKLSPSLLELKTVAPNVINAPIILENLKNEPANLRIEFKKFQADQESIGKIIYSDEPDPDFKKIAIIENDTPKTDIVIGPGQKKNLNLQIRLDEDHEPQDYYFSVIFTRHQDIAQADDPGGGLHAFTRVNLGVAMNVLLSVEDAKNNNEITSENLIIEEFNAPNFTNKGPVNFTVKIQNKKSNYIKPKGSIYITNMFGQLIGKMDLPSQNILAGSSRYIGSQNHQSVISNQSSVPKVIWPEIFLLGPYDAELVLETGPSSEPITQSLRFIAIPTRLIVTIAFSIIFGLLIYKRTKAKMAGK